MDNNQLFNDLNYSVEGLKNFVSKKIKDKVIPKKISFMSKLRLLNALWANNLPGKTEVKIYNFVMLIFMFFPVLNLLISIFFGMGLHNVMKDAGVFIFSFAVVYSSPFVMASLLKDEIDNYIERFVIKDVNLNKQDVLELGIYLQDEDKDVLVNKINRESKISLLEINKILLNKESEKEKLSKIIIEENKKKELEELAGSIRLIK